MTSEQKKWPCPQCDCMGYIMIEEDGFEREHACYHCGTLGYVTYDPDLGPNEDADDEQTKATG